MVKRSFSHYTAHCGSLHKEAKTRGEIAWKQLGFQAVLVKVEETCLFRTHQNFVQGGEHNKYLGLRKITPRYSSDRLK